MAVGDIYQLVLNHTVLGVACVNRFWYRMNTLGTGSPAAGLAESFDGFILDVWKDCVSDDVVFQSIAVTNYANPLDFTVRTPTITTGTRTPATFTLPPELVCKLKFNRNGPGTRYTFKAISGLLREDIDNSGLTAAAVAILDDLGNALEVPQNFSGNIWDQVQVQGTPVLGVNPTSYFVVNTWLTAAFGTQNTRKQ